MKYTLPPLPYTYDALEPYIDAKTMEIHHTKHHQTYVDKLNAAFEKHPAFFNQKVEELLKDSGKMPDDLRTAVVNYGGGHVNHSLFWECMTPFSREREMKGAVAEALTKTFGSFDAFKKQFTEFALNRFGSGWAWLIRDYSGELALMSTANQDSPLMFSGRTPLLGLDVWEHAYYLHYQNRRADYVTAWWNVVNWKKVNDLYAADLSI